MSEVWMKPSYVESNGEIVWVEISNNSVVGYFPSYDAAISKKGRVRKTQIVPDAKGNFPSELPFNWYALVPIPVGIWCAKLAKHALRQTYTSYEEIKKLRYSKNKLTVIKGALEEPYGCYLSFEDALKAVIERNRSFEKDWTQSYTIPVGSLWTRIHNGIRVDKIDVVTMEF